MNENFNVLNLPDEMLHITLMDGQAKVLLCRTTAMARKAAEIHCPSSTALAALRRQEAVASAALLGVHQVFFLGKPFGKTEVVSLSEKDMENAEAVCDGGFYRKEDLILGLADMVTRFRPDLVFGPDPLSRSECHIDHLNVGEAVRQVACFAPFSGILSQYLSGRKAVEGVPVQGVAFYMTARPNRTVRTSEGLVKAQFSSISLHRSQYPEGSAELKSIFTYLKLRSLNYGLHRFSLHAEGFRMLGATHMHCLPEA